VAERVVRELRDKVGDLNLAAASRADKFAAQERNGAGPSILDDAVSALVNLGYKPAEARRAVDSVGASEGDGSLESLLRKSLAVILGEK
jgi:Holliday junction DNA helicase RuvA